MKRICVLMCLLLILGMMPTLAQADEIDGEIRVCLLSLGDISRLGIAIEGEYSVNENTGMRLESGARLSVVAGEDSLYLICGAFTMEMGASFTLTRHGAGGGLYLEGSPRGLLYQGDLELTLQNGLIIPVLKIGLEDYLVGVVPYEMSDSFPIEALKAQAIAARTYVLLRRESRESRGYDVVDTTADQVFMGYDPAAVNAVDACRETEGMACMFDGGYGNCYYTASNGGQTLLPGDVWKKRDNGGYTVRRDDPYDVANGRSVVKTAQINADGTGLTEEMMALLMAGAGEQLASLGYSDDPQDCRLHKITGMELTDPKAEDSRWYSTLRVTYSVQGRPIAEEPEKEETEKTEKDSPAPASEAEEAEIAYAVGEFETVEGEFVTDIPLYDVVKDGMGLAINGGDYELFTLIVEEDEEGNAETFTLESRRFGHGVGMSQRGAQEMAGVYGMSCEEILNFYYPAMTVETHTVGKTGREALPPLDIVQSEILPELETGEKYGVVRVAGVSNALNIRSEPTTESEVIAQAVEGQRIIVCAEAAEGWYAVRNARFTGYAAAEYIEVE